MCSTWEEYWPAQTLTDIRYAQCMSNNQPTCYALQDQTKTDFCLYKQNPTKEVSLNFQVV